MAAPGSSSWSLPSTILLPTSLSRSQRIAIIGLAAGTVARQAVAVFGPLPIDGYEIDPAIIAVGQQYFGMDIPSLTAYAEDGRYGLGAQHRALFDHRRGCLPPTLYSPHLTTQEFFQQASDHLTDDGVLAINVGRSPTDRTLINDLASTLQTVFPSVYVVDVPVLLQHHDLCHPPAHRLCQPGRELPGIDRPW